MIIAAESLRPTFEHSHGLRTACSGLRVEVVAFLENVSPGGHAVALAALVCCWLGCPRTKVPMGWLAPASRLLAGTQRTVVRMIGRREEAAGF